MMNANQLSTPLGSSPRLRNSAEDQNKSGTLMPTTIIDNDDAPSMPGRLVAYTHRCSSPEWNARKKGKVLVPEDIPTYGEIKEDTSGSAIVPCNF